MAEWLQYLIMVVIIGGIALAIRRGGAANPESTGELRKTLSKMETRLKAVETTVGGAASSEELNTLRAEIRGDRELAKITAAGVKRIEDYLIERGLGGRR